MHNTTQQSISSVSFHHEDYFDGLCTLIDQFYALHNLGYLQLVSNDVLCVLK